MATSCRKRKYKEENRSFLPEWEEDFAFIDKEGSLVCVQSKKKLMCKVAQHPFCVQYFYKILLHSNSKLLRGVSQISAQFKRNIGGDVSENFSMWLSKFLNINKMALSYYRSGHP